MIFNEKIGFPTVSMKMSVFRRFLALLRNIGDKRVLPNGGVGKPVDQVAVRLPRKPTQIYKASWHYLKIQTYSWALNSVTGQAPGDRDRAPRRRDKAA